jgi:L-seryl-tRNA(Ser) seleniumtransferase
VTLAAVAATLALYRAGRAETEIPVWRMIAASPEDLRVRASVLARTAGGRAEVVGTAATVGGGSLPGETLPSFGVALGGRSADQMLAALRRGSPSVVGRIEAGRVILDLRTVDPGLDDELAAAIVAALGGRTAGGGAAGGGAAGP